MSADDNNRRPPKSHKAPTPQGLSTVADDREPRRAHRDYSNEKRNSRAMVPVPRDLEGVPDEEMDPDLNTPLGVPMIEVADFRARRASSVSKLALARVAEVSDDVKALEDKVDGVISSVSAVSNEVASARGELNITNSLLRQQLDAGNKQQELTLTATLGGQTAIRQAEIDAEKARLAAELAEAHAKIEADRKRLEAQLAKAKSDHEAELAAALAMLEENKAKAAHRRKVIAQIVAMILIPLAAAMTAYYFAAK